MNRSRFIQGLKGDIQLSEKERRRIIRKSLQKYSCGNQERQKSMVADDPASPLFLQPEADSHAELRSVSGNLSDAEKP